MHLKNETENLELNILSIFLIRGSILSFLGTGLIEASVAFSMTSYI